MENELVNRNYRVYSTNHGSDIDNRVGSGRMPASEIAIILDWPSDTVIVSETIYSYGSNDHVVARKSSSGRSIDGE